VLKIQLQGQSYLKKKKIAVYGGVIQLSDLIKNILICVPNMNEGLTGLGQHEST